MRLFEITFENGQKATVEAVSALQDGIWRKIAFTEMLRTANMTIKEKL